MYLRVVTIKCPNQTAKKAFKLLQKKDVDIIWCNARLGAFNFYKKLGFEVIGDIFNIKDIGPHYYMFKKF